MPRAKNVIPLNVQLRDRSYRWTNRDPDLDFVCQIITRAGDKPGDVIDRVYDATGEWLSHATIAKWLDNSTKRPSNRCLALVGRAYGYERHWERTKR